MKADYLRYIYECLSGENGLLGGGDDILNQRTSFTQEIQERKKNDASLNEDPDVPDVDCDICNDEYYN